MVVDWGGSAPCRLCRLITTRDLLHSEQKNRELEHENSNQKTITAAGPDPRWCIVGPRASPNHAAVVAPF
mgnify:CR=1 FL=1